MIIGFTGQKGSGKDTAGAYLVDHWNFKRVSFADKLKKSAAACWGINPEAWDHLKNNIDAYVEIKIYDNQNRPTEVASETVREFLQRYGTEAHRDIFGFDFWVNAALRTINDYWDEANSDDVDLVFTDVRFENEAIALKNRGGHIIQIERFDNASDTHASEAGLPESLLDGRVANIGSKEQLYVLLDVLVERLKVKDAG